MSSPPVPVVSPPEPPQPLTLVCANCHATLSGEYCAACGQRHEPHVHTVAHFAGEAFESVSHADSRLWRTLWYLLARPGFLTKEFFAGRRVRYLPPFRLYLVLSVIFFLFAGVSSDAPEDPGATSTDPAAAQLREQEEAAERKKALDEAQQAIDEARRQTTESGTAPGASETDDSELKVQIKGLDEFCEAFDEPEQGGSGATARRNVRQFCQKVQGDASALFTALGQNLPKAMFIFLPLLAVIMKLMYWRPKRYYVEHLLFLVHNHAFVFLMLIMFMLVDLLIHPLIGDYVWPFYVAGSLYTIWYIFRAMRNMYAQHGALTFLKYVVLGWTYVFTAFFTLLLTLIFLALTA
jgi:hypothetical protein